MWGWGYGGVWLGGILKGVPHSRNHVVWHYRGLLKQMDTITKVQRLHGAYMEAAKEKANR